MAVIGVPDAALQRGRDEDLTLRSAAAVSAGLHHCQDCCWRAARTGIAAVVLARSRSQSRRRADGRAATVHGKQWR
jgi:hypothetical protein